MGGVAVVAHVDCGTDDDACHDPEAATVVVFAVELGSCVEAEGLDGVGQTFGDVATEKALGGADAVQLEERLGNAFILSGFAKLVIREHGDAEDGEEEAQPDEVGAGWIFPVFIILVVVSRSSGGGHNHTSRMKVG